MTNEELESIERVATAQQAAHPGPYHTGSGYEQEEPGYYVYDAAHHIVVAQCYDAPLDAETRDYVAAVTPAAVLALIAECRRLASNARAESVQAAIVKERRRCMVLVEAMDSEVVGSHRVFPLAQIQRLYKEIQAEMPMSLLDDP